MEWMLMEWHHMITVPQLLSLVMKAFISVVMQCEPVEMVQEYQDHGVEHNPVVIVGYLLCFLIVVANVFSLLQQLSVEHWGHLQMG